MQVQWKWKDRNSNVIWHLIVGAQDGLVLY